ncbi:MAG: hypothetical protein ACRCXC_00210 [Legionella sp.]
MSQTSYFFLGKASFLSDDKKDDAISNLNKFIELTQNEVSTQSDNQKNRVYAFDLLGQCYAANNQDDFAITYYAAAIEADPLCASARHNMGLSYMQLTQDYLELHLQNFFILLIDAQVALKSALEI